MAIGVLSGYAGPVTEAGTETATAVGSAAVSSAAGPARKAFYGIAEIADALGLNRQLVTAWRRRRSHGMPEPDAELSSGPIWRGETVEPWIDHVRNRRTGDADQPITAEFAFRAGRRMLRLAAILLEQPVRPRLLSQAMTEARELLPTLDAAADDPLGLAVAQLLAPLRGPVDEAAELDAFRHRVLTEVAQVGPLIRLAAESLPDSEGGS